MKGLLVRPPIGIGGNECNDSLWPLYRLCEHHLGPHHYDLETKESFGLILSDNERKVTKRVNLSSSNTKRQ